MTGKVFLSESFPLKTLAVSIHSTGIHEVLALCSALHYMLGERELHHSSSLEETHSPVGDTDM